MARRKQPAARIDLKALDASEIRVRLKELGPVAEIRLTRANLPLFEEDEFELSLAWGGQRKKYKIPVREGKPLFGALPDSVPPIADRKPQKGGENLIRELTLAGAAGEATFPMSWGYAVPEEWKPLERLYSRIIEMARDYSGWQVF
ncbi:MAG TPA: hypothetical protein PKN59_02900 [Syntrophales bacterium]|nr:hypothetical protein [Syntrophales bacterium]HNS53796.1 hypothetical protein [Syntrophales bacterium]